MNKLSKLLFALLLLAPPAFAAGELPKVQSFTNAFEQDCFVFAQGVAVRINRGQVETDAIFDVDSLMGRSAGGTGEALPPGLETTVKEAFRTTFSSYFRDARSARPVQVRREGKEVRAVLRLLMQNGGFNYVELVCEKRYMVQPSGNFIEPPRGYNAVQAVDMLDLAKGEYVSEVVHRTGKILQENWQKSGGKWGGRVKALNELRQLEETGDWAGILQAWKKLPTELQTYKGVAALRVKAASHVSPEEHIAALRFIQLNFPRDPSMEFVTFDSLCLQKKFEQALGILDRIDQRIGGDPYLDYLRGMVCEKMNRVDDARAYYKECLRREPELAVLIKSGPGAVVKTQAPGGAPAVASTATQKAPPVAGTTRPSTPIPVKLRLQGIFMRTDRPSAMISGQTYYEGETVEGLQIVKIANSRVTLQSPGGETHSLSFD